MQTQVLSYRIIIEPEKHGRKTVYNAYCPTLGLADYGDSIDQAMKNIQALIKFHVESLLQEDREVPTENTAEEIITSAKVSINKELNKDYQVIIG